MSIAIDVENLSKRYVISHLNKSGPQSLREVFSGYFYKLAGTENLLQIDENEPNSNASTEEFWALKDVSFQVKEGERVAVIGGNGAGKSTLLKILSRITEPTAGKVSIRGKVASLLEVGTGFHPELSGRENIYLNGAILGMPRKEIQRKFDKIVDFSGVEKFIDTPVKFYSSGMYVRLAFSVSAWLDPDILIVDEVLSVGDQAFQKKCAERMKELTGEGRTVVFVSHSMAAIKSMCQKALYLKSGEVVSFSSVDEAATDYIRTVNDEGGGPEWHKGKFSFDEPELTKHVDQAEFVVCIGGEIRDHNGCVASKLDIDKPFQVVLRYKIIRQVPFEVVPNFHFYDEGGARFFVSFPEFVSPTSIGEHLAICNIEPFQFNVGRYNLMPALSSYEMTGPLHFAVEEALRFEVFEPAGVDSRRHGWNGVLPGVTRPRLKWDYK